MQNEYWLYSLMLGKWFVYTYQNNLACVVLANSAYLNASSLLHRLHWLSIDKCVQYKNALLTYNTLSAGQPIYCRSLSDDYQPSCTLHSATHQQLSCPPVTSELGQHSFSYSAPHLWNDLHLHILKILYLQYIHWRNILKTYCMTAQPPTHIHFRFDKFLTCALQIHTLYCSVLSKREKCTVK